MNFIDEANDLRVSLSTEVALRNLRSPQICSGSDEKVFQTLNEKNMTSIFACTIMTLAVWTSLFFNGNNNMPTPTSRITEAPDSVASIYDFVLTSLDGKDVSLSQFKGKKLLIVNTASECGYTPQYADIEKLYREYGSKVVVLGFPANNFGAQEPGTNEQIKTFCEKNYGVTFPMFEKISVAGADQHPMYKWLTTKEANGWNDQAPKWNFWKYLVDENGVLRKVFPSKVKPMSEEVLREIGD